MSEPIRVATKWVAGPATEPLSLADAKAQCRLFSTDEDALVASWIVAARRKVEQDTSRVASVAQTWDLFLDAFPSERQPIVVPWPPLVSVTGVYATDASGVETTLLPANYLVDTASEPGRLGLTGGGAWPSDLRIFQPGRVRFVAGYADAQIPEDLKRAMALLIGWFSENREPAAFERNVYDALIAPYVIYAVG